MLAAAPPAAAASVNVSAKLRGDAVDIAASAVLDADAATAWRVLTDYDRYPDFIPDLRVSHVVARDGANVTVEQSGVASLWLVNVPVAVTVEVSEAPPYGLRSTAVSHSLGALAGSYALAPTGAGVSLTFTGRVAAGSLLFRHLGQLAVERNVTRQFQALADEIERSSAARRGDAGAAGR